MGKLCIVVYFNLLKRSLPVTPLLLLYTVKKVRGGGFFLSKKSYPGLDFISAPTHK
jgi:hypothetical protein